MRYSLFLIASAFFAFGFISSGAMGAILFDIDSARTQGDGITVQDFYDAGVAEDLSGATPVTVIASVNSNMTGGGVTLGYVTNQANSDWGNTNYGNLLLDDYLAIDRDAANPGPVTMQVSGLADDLVASTDYYLYLFGTGDAANQNATFTFNSQQIATSGAAPGSDAASQLGRFAKYTFTTGATVDDSLQFTWARTDANQYAGLNGFAIVEVPGPAPAGLIVDDHFRNGDFGSVDGADQGSGHTTYTNGKSASEASGGPATWATDGGNWQKYQLHSNDTFTPDAAELTWEFGNFTVLTNDTGGPDGRWQLGINSANHTRGTDSEMWKMIEGGVWLDIRVEADNSTSVGFTVLDGNDTKSVDTNGTSRASGTISGWDWANETRTIRLVLDATGYEWFDGSTSLGGETWATAGIGFGAGEEFENGVWAFLMGQNNNAGRAGGEVHHFSLTVVPEPSTLALTTIGLLGLLSRRRRRRGQIPVTSCQK